jgi:Bacterial SH3 domain
MSLKGSSRVVCLVLCLGLVAPPQGWAEAVVSQVRVTATLANVRSQPSVKGSVLFQVKHGEELVLLGEASGWYHVRDAAGREGYLEKDLAEAVVAASQPGPPPPPPPPPPPAKPASESGPSIEHQPVSCIVAETSPRLGARFDPDTVAKPRVYFRADGTAYWYYVDMGAAAGGYEGILPKAKEDTKKIDYYIEALAPTLTSGRTQEYAPIVVKSKSDCDGKMMAGVAASAGKVVVGSLSAQAPPLPAGFEAAGIVAAGAAAGATGAQAASGGSHTLLYVAGGVVVAGGVALAAKGGGGSSSSSAPAASVTGTWTGPLASQSTVTGDRSTIICNDTQTMTLQLTQSGSALSGTAHGTVAHGTCNPPNFTGTATGLGAPESITGTASNGQISLSASNGGVFTGTYTANTMTLGFTFNNSQGGGTVAVTGTADLTKP